MAKLMKNWSNLGGAFEDVRQPVLHHRQGLVQVFQNADNLGTTL